GPASRWRAGHAEWRRASTDRPCTPSPPRPRPRRHARAALLRLPRGDHRAPWPARGSRPTARPAPPRRRQHPVPCPWPPPPCLGPAHLAGGVANVVTEHGTGQAVDAGRLASLGDRFHRVLIFAESGWPVPPARAAWISAMIASAISGALRAPRSSPMGTRTRLS